MPQPLVTCSCCGREVKAVWPSKVRVAAHKAPDGHRCSNQSIDCPKWKK